MERTGRVTSEEVKEGSEKQSTFGTSASQPFSLSHGLSVDLPVHWIPGAVFCANRKLHTLSALEEELAKRRTCPAVGGSDESCQIHLQATVVLDKQAALPWHECSH